MIWMWVHNSRSNIDRTEVSIRVGINVIPINLMNNIFGIISFALTFCMMPCFISFMRSRFNLGQPIRACGPQSHIVSKKGTPTMGGMVMLLGMVVSILLGRLDYGAVIILSIALFGGLGFVDDYIKLTRRNVAGVLIRYKLLVQCLCAIIVCSVVYATRHDASIAIPFTHAVIHAQWWVYILFTSIVVVSSSNAVNLTDGLDGLVIVPIMLSAGYFGYKDHSLIGISQVIVGSGLGFLWFNAFPAKIFMGDVGSLALGAILGVMSVISHSELEFIIVGLLFVIEALSVIMQIGSFKLRNGKRIFRMAPIHHHFEHCGMHEQCIVLRAWIISAVLLILLLR